VLGELEELAIGDLLDALCRGTSTLHHHSIQLSNLLVDPLGGGRGTFLSKQTALHAATQTSAQQRVALG
jgi:hypothetical protein